MSSDKETSIQTFFLVTETKKNSEIIHEVFLIVDEYTEIF